ncbi:MAG: 50S ribosomal protein L6 [Deltaproteobacteria bacterium]|nr:MAG: 50S ribosomal protein L6 [Deltaproteobacteria bacterium]
MSRIGKMPVPVPSGVQVEIKDQSILVKGKKGVLERELRPEMDVVLKDNEIQVGLRLDNKQNRAFRGLTRSLINNMVVGVEEGFRRALIVEGVGYKVSVSGSRLTLNVGYSNPVEFELPENVTASVEQNKIALESIDKELLGLTASRIRQIRKPEPYKGKGIRYEDERIVRKVGKAGAAK